MHINNKFRFDARKISIPSLVKVTETADSSQKLAILDRFAGPADLPLILSKLDIAQEISLDLETTHLTPWLAPLAISDSKKLGGGLSRKKYCVEYSTTFNESVRARILSVETDSGLKCAIDLDLLSEEEKLSLISALENKTLVGHNLAFDIAWLNHIKPGFRVSRILDTMLLPICVKPDVEFRMTSSVANEAYIQNNPIKQKLRDELISRSARQSKTANKFDASAGVFSLNFLTMFYLNEELDKSYQAPENWMPRHLTAAHLQYCLGDTRAPRIIARKLLDLPLNTSVAGILSVLDNVQKTPGGAAYRIMERALMRLVQMQHNGIRMCPDAVSKFDSKLKAAAAAKMADLLTIAPDLAPFADDILATDSGLTDAFKTAFFVSLTAKTGKEPPKTDKGGLTMSSDVLLEHYGKDEQIISIYGEIAACVKQQAMLADYLKVADDNFRIHPSTTIRTITGRTASSSPNLQNMPHDPRFRECFRAAPGNKIIATDFSAAQMRIAACLAERDYAYFVKKLAGNPVLQKIPSLPAAETVAVSKPAAGRRFTQQTEDEILYDVPQDSLAIPGWICKSAPEPFSQILQNIQNNVPTLHLIPAEWHDMQSPGRGASSWHEHGRYLAVRYAIVLARMQAAGCNFKYSWADIEQSIQKMALAQAFRTGVDPHCVTAINVESMGGRFDLQGKTALQYVIDLDSAGRKQLKKDISGPRQAAKALNFGLLFGMSAGGLYGYGKTSYGLSWTREEAAQARMAWFALYPEIELGHLIQKTDKIEKNQYVLKHGNFARGKLFLSKTLSNRPVCGGEDRNALNYQNQGTEAEIALESIANLPDWLADCFVNFVHDELIFEVPEGRVGEAKSEIEAAMNGAADRLFNRFQVPSEVESAVGDYWIH